MAVPLFSTLAVAMLGGGVFVAATILDAADRRDDEVTARVVAERQAERRAAQDERTEARQRLHDLGTRCRKDREKARRINRRKEPRSCERYEKMAADWRKGGSR